MPARPAHAIHTNENRCQSLISQLQLRSISSSDGTQLQRRTQEEHRASSSGPREGEGPGRGALAAGTKGPCPDSPFHCICRMSKHRLKPWEETNSKLAASKACFHSSFQQQLIALPQGPGNRVLENQAAERLTEAHRGGPQRLSDLLDAPQPGSCGAVATTKARGFSVLTSEGKQSGRKNMSYTEKLVKVGHFSYTGFPSRQWPSPPLSSHVPSSSLPLR